MIEACFACTTPYQIIGAISITLGKKIDADLFVFGMFPNYQVVCENIRKQNIFHKVYDIDCSDIGWPSRGKAFFQMKFASQVVSSFLPPDVSYRAYYSSSRAHPKTLLQYVLLQRNPSMERVIYEDGLGTYAGNSHPLNATKLRKLSETILGWKLDVPEKTTMMASIPELVDIPEYLQECEVVQMPRLDFDTTTSNMLKSIFSVDDSRIITSRIIIFDTLRPNPAYLNEDDFRIIDECYRIIGQAVEYKDVIVKPHPRSKYNGDHDIALYEYQEVPMEVLYAGMQDLDQLVLITYTSSAVFTPKIMFDKEPVVISLHRILSNTKSSIIFDPIYEKFKSIYSNKEKVAAPETLNELELLVGAI